MFKVYKYGHREFYHQKLINNDFLITNKKEINLNLKEIPDFPLVLHIETTSYCDNNCFFCTRREKNRKNQHMSEYLFKKIIDECAEHKINLICLFKDGDPVLHPKIDEFIKYAKDKNVSKNITIATGANALNHDLSKKIILSGLDNIFFSVDSLTEEKYKKIKGTDNYGKVLENIFDFVRIKENLKSSTPRIIVKMLATDIVKDDIDLFIRLWINIADLVLIDKEITIWDGTNKRVSDVVKNMKNYNYGKPKIRYPCNRPWYMISIYSDGKVTICPEDWNQKMIIGDVNNDNIFDIWNGDKLNSIRKHHIEGNWNQLSACQFCEAYVLKNIGNWFRENKDKSLSQKGINNVQK